MQPPIAEARLLPRQLHQPRSQRLIPAPALVAIARYCHYKKSRIRNFWCRLKRRRNRGTPEAYTGQELEGLSWVSDGDEDEKFLWRFFLGTGFRESAVAEVTDINRDTK